MARLIVEIDTLTPPRRSSYSSQWRSVRVGSANKSQTTSEASSTLFLASMRCVLTLVVLEATGGLEQPVAAALAEAGVPMAVVNPRQVRDFAKAVGKLAKTDILDAKVLAHFAEAVRPEPRPLPDEQAQLLSATVLRRRQIIAMSTSEENRLSTAPNPVRRRIEVHLCWLRKELERTSKELEQIVHESPIWREKAALLRSVPGVGPTLSVTLLAELPELEQLNRKQLGALVGAAPLNRARAPYAVRVPFGAGAPALGQPSIWRRSVLFALTQPLRRSTRGCALRANRRR